MQLTRVFLRVILMGAASASLLAAQSAPQTDAQRQLARADSAFLQGQLQAAADGYRVIVQREPSNEVAWYRLGLSLERSDRRDEAIVAYERAAHFPSQQQGAELGLTRLFVKAGNTDRALEHLRRLAGVGIDPAALDQFPALAPLRSHPQYPAIRKLAEESRFPCRNVHTFDFWVGDFDANQWYQTTAPANGKLHNTREYDGCVIIEHWTPGPGGGAPGMSMAFYDQNRKAWRFIWNDDSNQSVEFTGDYRDGAMRLEAWVPNPDGTKSLARNVLQNVSPDTIRHIFSVSGDSGKTWTIQSDGRFVRRKP